MPEATDLLQRLKSADLLPSQPGFMVRILEIIRQDEVSTARVAEVVGTDPALTARILKFTNSPLTGLSRRVSSLQHAISLVGHRGVKMLALSFSLVSMEKKRTSISFDYERFWSKSLACAVAARVIAQHTNAHVPEEAFVAGLLSEIGQLVLASGIPAEYEQVLHTARREGCDLSTAERKVIGTTHSEIGSKLIEEWHFPEQLCAAIAQFREMAEINHDDETPSLAHILYAADLAAEIIRGADYSPSTVDMLLRALDHLFAIDADQWATMFEEITQQWQEYGMVLTIPTSQVKSFREIEAEARERIAELAMALQLEHQVMKERQDELIQLARTDRLTGVGNRPAFDERLTLELERARRTGRPMALLIADIDHFKSFNDTYGHQAGDLVLQTVAGALQAVIRKVDLLARYGGEEFALIAPECTLQGARDLAERLRMTVEQINVDWDGQPLCVTISVGGALAHWPDHGSSANDLIARADQQLYAAKRAGRNCCKLANLSQSVAGKSG